MEKRIICLAVGIMIFVFFPAHAFTLLDEAGVDRPGCDFTPSFVVPGPNPDKKSKVSDACKNACGVDPNCQAWNFDARSGTRTCFLKNIICPAVISGTDGGIKLPATMSEPEIQVERNGCDFTSFAATNPITHVVDDYICIRTCAENDRCQAWNFDPRVGGGACFLKDCVPAPSVSGSSAVHSGVKFSQ